MDTDLVMVMPPGARYVRHIEGTDFSLEANTERVPDDGRFYLLHRGSIELVTDDFRYALVAYHALCRTHWRRQLRGRDAAQRLASAWGLVGLEPEHEEARAVIREEGSPEDRKRLEQVRSKKRALRQHVRQRERAAG